MRKLSIPFILPWLAFIIPVNIYIIGDWSSVGIQWVLFRYQQSLMGISYISIGNDINYILMGLLQTRTLVSVLLWFLGTVLLLISIILILKDLWQQAPESYKKTGLLIFLSGCLFLIADIIQYGPILFSKYSICVPVGIPLLVIIGYWEYHHTTKTPAVTNQEYLQPFYTDNSLKTKFISFYNSSPVFQELAVLLVVSIFVKIMVFTLSVYSPQEVIQVDVKMYYNYFRNLLTGNLPYTMFSVEYPQFFFIPVFIAALPTLIIQDYSVFFPSFLMLMYLFDMATLVCVYLIAIRLFGQNRAFLCGLLYTTAFSTVYYVPLTYDIFPTFLLMLALLMFLYGRDAAAYISATAGVLAKWFPIFCYPLFFLYSLKNDKTLRPTFRGVIISALIIVLSTAPLFFLKPDIFLFTYRLHLSRPEDSHSLIYYLDVISSSFLHIQPFFGLSFILLVIGECACIAWYYGYLNKKPVTLCAVLFLSIFYFFLINKVASPNFLIWITPLLAIFFINSAREIILFYLIQLIMYIEAPVLTGIIWISGVGYPLIENALPSFAFLFYTVKFAILGLAFIWVIWRCHREFSLKEEKKRQSQ